MVTDNPAENRTDVFVPGAWPISSVVMTTYTARPGELVRVDAQNPVTIRLHPAAGKVGAEVVIKEVAGEEETIEIYASTGQQIARDGYPLRHLSARQRRRDGDRDLTGVEARDLEEVPEPATDEEWPAEPPSAPPGEPVAPALPVRAALAGAAAQQTE